ncbi:MAG: hypothetical protein ACR2GC_04005 [Methyloceanibacter sp.]|uniref:hypothetical protein n=1 Tax=Methyloceanibacter sp. TaxID=1965321 RepID=UPI003D9AE731
MSFLWLPEARQQLSLTPFVLSMLRRFGLDLGFKSRGFIAEADARGGFLIAGRARRRTTDLGQFRL